MTISSEESWLKTLKKGDLVILSTRGGFNRTLKVSRTTKTQIILEGFTGKFRISDGCLIGAAHWSWSEIIEPTKKIIDAMKKEKLIRTLSNTDWKEFELDTLTKIMFLLKKLP